MSLILQDKSGLRIIGEIQLQDKILYFLKGKVAVCVG